MTEECYEYSSENEVIKNDQDEETILIYENLLKNSKADQDTLKKCGQMRFIFQNSLPWSPHTSSIGVAVLGSHWSKSYQQQI